MVIGIEKYSEILNMIHFELFLHFEYHTDISE